MKARQASPPGLRKAFDTFAADATGSDGLPAGSEVSTRILRTPRAASLARIAATPLSNAGLLLSPAISTTRQPAGGTAPPTGTAGGSGERATAGGAPVDSGVQAAASKSVRRNTFTRTDMPDILRLTSAWLPRHATPCRRRAWPSAPRQARRRDRTTSRRE